MGIVQKQSVHTMIIVLAGVGVGAISRLIMPFFLSREQVGALALIDSISSILATVFCLGFTQVTLKLFRDFKNDNNGHSGYLTFALLYSIFGIILGIITFLFFEDFFIGIKEENLLAQSVSYAVIPLIAFRILFKNIDTYLRMLYSTVLGSFLEGFLLKLLILLSVLIFAFNLCSFDIVVILYIFSFALPGLILLFAAIYKTGKIVRPDSQILRKQPKKEIFNFAFYGLLASASGVLILSIDQLMLNRILGTEQVGVYSVLFFAGMLVSIPARGIKRVAVPILSEAWKKNNMKEIKTFYQKSASNNLVVGIYLIIVGWACLDPALTFLPKYVEGKFVFLFIALAQLCDMGTGINMEIIATSKKYRYNTYFNIILAILVIGLNSIFINIWGIMGAAFASFIAVFIINTARLILVYRSFGLLPFKTDVLKILVIGILLFSLVSIIELPFIPIPSMLVWFTLLSLIYWFLILKLGLAEDISNWLLKIKTKLLKK